MDVMANYKLCNDLNLTCLLTADVTVTIMTGLATSSSGLDFKVIRIITKEAVGMEALATKEFSIIPTSASCRWDCLLSIC